MDAGKGQKGEGGSLYLLKELLKIVGPKEVRLDATQRIGRKEGVWDFKYLDSNGFQSFLPKSQIAILLH